MRSTRRAFLKQAAIGAGAGFAFPAIIPSSVLGADGAVAPSNRITLGFIGLGYEGKLKNLKHFLMQPDTEVVALCDVHGLRLHGAHVAMQVYAKAPSVGMYRKCMTTRDWREVIARHDIDAVVVSTPDHWHVLPALAAAKAGKDVFCEKPVSLTIHEGRVLSDTMTHYGRIFQTGTEIRSQASVIRACTLARSGHLGKIQQILVEQPGGFGEDCNTQNPPFKKMPVPADFDYDMWLGPAPDAPYTRRRCHNSFRYILDYAGGNLTDWGGHFHDCAQWANGTDRSGPIGIEGHGVFATGGLFDAAMEWQITYEYANGVKCVSKNGRSCSVRFEGTDGWVQAGWGTFEASSTELARLKIDPAEAQLRACPEGEHRNFLDCVRSRQETCIPVEVGHRSASIGQLGNIAMQLGRKLRWNPETEHFLEDEAANKMLSRPMRDPWKLET